MLQATFFKVFILQPVFVFLNSSEIVSDKIKGNCYSGHTFIRVFNNSYGSKCFSLQGYKEISG